jgi:hypothetical protein
MTSRVLKKVLSYSSNLEILGLLWSLMEIFFTSFSCGTTTGTLYIPYHFCKQLLFCDIYAISHITFHMCDEHLLFQEFLKATVDLADLGGLYLVLMGIPGKGHAKVLTAGVGWAGADILLSRFLLLWVGARGAEIDWIYIQKRFDSNIRLVSSM